MIEFCLECIIASARLPNHGDLISIGAAGMDLMPTEKQPSNMWVTKQTSIQLACCHSTFRHSQSNYPQTFSSLFFCNGFTSLKQFSKVFILWKSL